MLPLQWHAPAGAYARLLCGSETIGSWDVDAWENRWRVSPEDMETWTLELRQGQAGREREEVIPSLEVDADPANPRVTLSTGRYVDCRSDDEIVKVSSDPLHGMRLVRFAEDGEPTGGCDDGIHGYAVSDGERRRDVLLKEAVDMLKPALLDELSKTPGRWADEGFGDVGAERSRIASLRMGLMLAGCADRGIYDALDDLNGILDASDESGTMERRRHDSMLEGLGIIVSFATLAQLVWQMFHDSGFSIYAQWGGVIVVAFLMIVFRSWFDRDQNGQSQHP